MSKEVDPGEELDFSEEMQKVLLQFMISCPDAFIRCQAIIRPEYFDPKFRNTVKFILSFADQYKALPNTEQIYATTNIDIPIVDKVSSQYVEWFLDTIEKFCRHKAMEIVIFQGPDLLEKGMSGYSELESRIKENMLISLQSEIGTDYFSNPEERLKRMKDRTGMTSTGWSVIDKKLYGGMNRGEVTMFAGAPGTGKSLVLQNLALNWVQMGLNVIYISLELSEDLIGLRLDAMVTGQPTKTIFQNLEDTALKIGMTKRTQKLGRLQIKKMPEAGTTVNKLRAYLKEFEIQTGMKIDGLLVDYLDLIYPNNDRINPSDLFIKDKYTSEELRGLASELNILCATASQLNRGAITSEAFDQSHIAGGISKINTADNVIALRTSEVLKERGEYEMFFLKTRSSAGVGSRVMLCFDNASLRITDGPDIEREDEDTSNKGMAGSLAQSMKDSLKQKTLGSTYNSGEAQERSETPKQIPSAIKNQMDKIRVYANKLHE